MTTLIDSLKALPNPALPRDLTADILARIEAIESPRPEPASAPSLSMWPIVLGSTLAAAAIAASTAAGDASLFRVSPLSIGRLGMPSSGVGAVTLLAGLALYAAGLFAPIRRSVSRT